MNDRGEVEQAGRPDPSAGLCATCAHARVILSDRGSRFIRCGLSDRDARFPRFPRLPVTACDGYERATVA